jgi:hypothetical protein
MVCPTAIEAAKRILDATMKGKPIERADAAAVSVELLYAVEQVSRETTDAR